MHKFIILLLFFISNNFTLDFLLAENDTPFKLPKKSEVEKINSALIKTNKGNLILKLFPKIAPWHVANLKYLADQDFYDHQKFHIFEKGYVIQSGAPTKEVNSGPGYSVPPEFSDLDFKKGALVMVRKPNDLDLEHTRFSHGSQFRILLKNVPSMKGRHTIFGKVVLGYDVLEKLRKDDVIEDLVVFVR